MCNTKAIIYSQLFLIPCVKEIVWNGIMQPISYGINQAYATGYPILPNCFDQLTTHGIVAEDVMGYITDNPSPYLQNYVAQRGWPPTGQMLPGQLLPDPLPTLQNPRQLPKGDVYQSVQPKHPDKNTLVVNKGKYDLVKTIAASILLSGLLTLGIIKGKNLWNRIFHRTPRP